MNAKKQHVNVGYIKFEIMNVEVPSNVRQSDKMIVPIFWTSMQLPFGRIMERLDTSLKWETREELGHTWCAAPLMIILEYGDMSLGDEDMCVS